jgi:hypothetical protein
VEVHNRHGMSDWRELMAQVSERLAETPPEQRALFAAGVAERLLTAHEARPVAARKDFTMRLRPLLDDVWAAACGDQTVARDITQRLGEFYVSDLYAHGDDEDADEDAAAAVLHAAECYVHSAVEYAVWARDRAAFAADELVQSGYSGDWAPVGESAGAIQRELERQWQDLDLIAEHGDEVRYARSGLPAAVTRMILAELRPRLVGPARRAAQQGEDTIEG